MAKVGQKLPSDWPLPFVVVVGSTVVVVHRPDIVRLPAAVREELERISNLYFAMEAVVVRQPNLDCYSNSSGWMWAVDPNRPIVPGIVVAQSAVVGVMAAYVVVVVADPFC